VRSASFFPVTPYTCSMPTPVGPAPPDPNDPDLWDWSGGDEEFRPRRRPLRVLLIGVMVLAMVLLVVVNVL